MTQEHLDAGWRLHHAGFSFQKTGIPGHLRSCCSTAAGHPPSHPPPPSSRVQARFLAPFVRPACLAFLEEHSDFPKLKEKYHVRGNSLSLWTFLSYLPEFRCILAALALSTSAPFGGTISWLRLFSTSNPSVNIVISNIVDIILLLDGFLLEAQTSLHPGSIPCVKPVWIRFCDFLMSPKRLCGCGSRMESQRE